MDFSNDTQQYERENLRKTVALIELQLDEELRKHTSDIEELKEERRFMWEETNHHTKDLEKLGEVLNSLTLLETKTASYEETVKILNRYKRMLSSPYFARIDFTEEGMDSERIYIGRANLMDKKTLDALVYDWRSPVASIFYRFGIGHAFYEAPYGKIEGELTAKRQFMIKNGQLEFYFDTNLNIIDEVLGEALAKNTSQKMQTIVETIQAQQDEIIRDDKNEVLVVQGVAGSGKTSVALHRVAYLMYQGMSEKLKANNIVIISPNDLFSTYISGVLPELGEENVASVLFEDICVKALDETMNPLSRNTLIEQLIQSDNTEKGTLLRDSVEFKGSVMFMTILDRLIVEYTHHLCDFQDLYYNGKCISTRQSQKEFLLNNVYHTPVAIRLKRLEERLIDQMREMRVERSKSISMLINTQGVTDPETKQYVHQFAVHEAAMLVENIRRYTRVDYKKLYARLFCDRQLFARMAKGFTLPENIDEIINYTREHMDFSHLPYEDSTALCYLTTKMAGIDEYKDIRQVVIDEAQDYYPIHYAVFKNIFKNARFTILGDINQTIEKNAEIGIYDEAIKILGRKKNVIMKLAKSYRSSVEIQKFSNRLLACALDTESFERHDESPQIILASSSNEMEDMIARDAENMLQSGLGSVAVICKSVGEAKAVQRKLSTVIDCALIDERTESQVSGVMVVPVYMAKGLEFDGVLLYDASSEKYNTLFDKQLLYIACTRPLHRLHVYYTQKLTEFLK